MEEQKEVRPMLHVYWISDEGTLYHYIFKPDDYKRTFFGRRPGVTVTANISFTQKEQTYHCADDEFDKFHNSKIFSFDITDNADAMKVIRKYYDDKIDELNSKIDKLYKMREKLG